MKARGSWLASGAVHVLLLLALTVGVAERAAQHTTYIALYSPRSVNLPPAPTVTPSHIPHPVTHPVFTDIPDVPPASSAPPAPPPPRPAAPTPPARRSAAPAAAAAAAAVGVAGLKGAPHELGPIIASPKMSDARIFPQARPALPEEVADALYRHPDTSSRDTVTVHRLRAMVDSLNIMLDSEQRVRRKPTWTTDVGGKKFGMDSNSIYVAGVKIPNPILAMLGNMLPQGNFDEALRARQMEYIREDIIQAARRTENMQDFRRYVREERERKQAQRDFEERQREGDTEKTKTKADTLTP